jgi:hypothetical protein
MYYRATPAQFIERDKLMAGFRGFPTIYSSPATPILLNRFHYRHQFLHPLLVRKFRPLLVWRLRPFPRNLHVDRAIGVSDWSLFWD